MNDKEQVKTIKAVYAGYDKSLNSKVKKPEKYGIQLIPEAAALISTAEPSADAKKRAYTRPASRAVKITVRMSKTRRTALQRLCRANGTTVQDFLLDYIVESIEKAASEKHLGDGAELGKNLPQ
ncbi:hypothetical protein IKE71_03750 [Candidatus Saccharibacteria bacterium]|nr:hypothetical protein [Candidatus Saccharibacteria bacterium]